MCAQFVKWILAVDQYVQASASVVTLVDETAASELEAIDPADRAHAFMSEAFSLLHDNPGWLRELASFKSPHPIVSTIVVAIRIMAGDLEEAPTVVAAEKSWSPQGMAFCKALAKGSLSFMDPESYLAAENSDAVAARLEIVRAHYLNLEKFTFEYASERSRVCAQFVKWILAVDQYVQASAPIVTLADEAAAALL